MILAVSSCDDPSDISKVYSEVSNIGLLCRVPTGLPSLPLTHLITFAIFLFPSWSGNRISAPRYESNMSSFLRHLYPERSHQYQGGHVLDRAFRSLSPWSLHMPLLLDPVRLH